MTRALTRILAGAGIAALLAGCGIPDRLSQIGQAPALSPITSPTDQAGYVPVQMPMPEQEPPRPTNSPSLVPQGATSFFRDQRARRVGDILTVNVTISDSASVDNATERSRSGTEGMGAGGVIGTALGGILPAGTSADGLVNLNSSTASGGAGSIARSEVIRTVVAAVITQVLPNGNLVIEGRQEVRVNFEVRELLVAGIVRPQDIGSDNTVESSKIAEARISYGGRGQITDVQQPRYGQQVLDVLLPF